MKNIILSLFIIPTFTFAQKVEAIAPNDIDTSVTFELIRAKMQAHIDTINLSSTSYFICDWQNSPYSYVLFDNNGNFERIQGDTAKAIEALYRSLKESQRKLDGIALLHADFVRKTNEFITHLTLPDTTWQKVFSTKEWKQIIKALRKEGFKYPTNEI